MNYLVLNSDNWLNVYFGSNKQSKYSCDQFEYLCLVRHFFIYDYDLISPFIIFLNKFYNLNFF